MAHISLSSAFLCPDCSEIGDNSRACACCGNRALLSLANALNREVPDSYAMEEVLFAIETELEGKGKR